MELSPDASHHMKIRTGPKGALRHSSEKKVAVMDGNEAAAHVAYRLNDIVAIYPITPSSTMGEHADSWAEGKKENIWGAVPTVVEMQSEAGAAGVLHGALQAGSKATTFTSSQGLLLMIPNMYKIAGELTPAVFHVAARAIATQALSIFGDHSDVMAARSTGFAMLCSNSVQEAMDFALIAEAASLESRIPFVHFFDGFRTSHEISKIEVLTDDDIRSMVDHTLVDAHHNRALSPDSPVIRGTSQNPDAYFQSRETVNRYYEAGADIVEKIMKRFHERTGRRYRTFEYHGAVDAERVIVTMGSSAETVADTVDHLIAKGEKVGLIKVRLFRPFDVKRFFGIIPKTARSIAVLDRTKEPGSAGEPLYLDVVCAVQEAFQQGFTHLQNHPKIIGGRYGIGSKEFTPAMAKGIFDHLGEANLKTHFTIGITDDVTHTSLDYDAAFSLEPPYVTRALFYGLGSDGTVSANKNSIKIIGEDTKNYIQGYFVYDSKKAGAVTVSHLRFSPTPIRSSYLISKAQFLACHHPSLLERYSMLDHVQFGGTFLLNSPHSSNEIWKYLPAAVAKQIIDKQLKFYVIDAFKLARDHGMGGRINTIMQTCFFQLSHILNTEKALAGIKKQIVATYGSKGSDIVDMNLKVVDAALNNLHEVKKPDALETFAHLAPLVSDKAPEFVHSVLGEMIAGRGDELPVGAFPADGTYPVGTSCWEKRNLAQEIPVWDSDICIQCGKCAFVCPHSVIRIKIYNPEHLTKKPDTFKSCAFRDRDFDNCAYTIQVAPEDCTGCAVCVDVCPAKNKSETRLKALNMQPQEPLRESERDNWDFFLTLPEFDRRKINPQVIRLQQIQQPLFEFSSACAGCGETPYLKLLSQLFGDRVLIANATGCSSIYGGNLPTTPWTKNAEGRGPAWSNSLFEDNAEFGLGMRLSLNHQAERARFLLKQLSDEIGRDFATAILLQEQKNESDIYDQRFKAAALKEKLAALHSPEAKELLTLADYLVRKSVWVVGGDGWAYDIGYGGLDHVLATGENVKMLVLDTEVYSNTGGQMSKATPRAAVAKFAAGGKPGSKKDLGLMAMTYGNVYVAQVAMGARDEQTLKAFLEAEAYEGPSLIIAYSHCIAHGINMSTALQNQKAAVETGHWLLYRYNPDLAKNGGNPFILDSRSPKRKIEEFFSMENRFKMLKKIRPEEAKKLEKKVQEDIDKKWHKYDAMARQNGTKDKR